MNKFTSLILSLPTSSPTERMRVWRALKATGAAVLRDGVYLLPNEQQYKEVFENIAEQIRLAGGSACVLVVEEPANESFKLLFDRAADYVEVIEGANNLAKKLKPKAIQDQLKEARKLRKLYEAILAIDFYADEFSRQANSALELLESKIAAIISPDEPHAIKQKIAMLKVANYQGKTWATRSGLWIDRLASAWLIRKYIDPTASFIWLKTPNDCPRTAIGFDFDGATFTHTDGLVTFEVIAKSFAVDGEAIGRLGKIVHALDVGGIQPAEAQGIEAIISGLKASSKTDDELLEKVGALLDVLIVSFAKEGVK